MSYRVVGSIVRYVSAERGGAEEEIPLALIDLDATHRWEKQHAQPGPVDPNNPPQPPAIDPELLKEEAERAALTPEVAKDLRLPEEDSTLALDTYRGTPELVPLAQTDSDLNRNTGHNLLKAGVNPLSAAHPIVTLKGEVSPIQLHVKDPVLYLRIGDESVGNTAGTPLTVDTHGATSRVPNDPDGGSPKSRYVIVRADVRVGARVIDSFRIPLLGTGQHQEDVVETTTELLPGGHWLKVTPKGPSTSASSPSWKSSPKRWSTSASGTLASTRSHPRIATLLSPRLVEGPHSSATEPAKTTKIRRVKNR